MKVFIYLFVNRYLITIIQRVTERVYPYKRGDEMYPVGTESLYKISAQKQYL